MYKLKYLPLAQKDLRDITNYYIVTEHEVEIQRIIYAKMDIVVWIYRAR
jgi:plasmid stabilization system protein ParE